MELTVLSRKDSLSKGTYLIVLISITVFWFLFLGLSQTLFSGFHFTDDHEIIELHHQFASSQTTLAGAVIHKIQYDIWNFGRFRPFYYVYRCFQIAIFGTHWLNLSIFNGLLASFTTFLLFTFGTFIQFSIIESLVFATITTLGAQSAIWWQLGPAETIATFLLTLSLNLLVLSIKQNQTILKVIYLILFILTTLCKESFLLLIPAILLLEFLCYLKFRQFSVREAIVKTLPSLVLLTLVGLAEIIFIKFFIDTDFGYAGLIFDLQSLLKTWKSYGYASSIVALFFLLILTSLKRPKAENFHVFSTIAIVSLLFLLIILPQALLYSKSGLVNRYFGLIGRYFLPGIIGYALLMATLLHVIRWRSKLLGYFALALVILALIFRLNNAFAAAQSFAQEGKATNALLNFVTTRTQPNSEIVIVSNPFRHFEWILSIAKYLKYTNQAKNLYLSTYGSQRADYFTNIFIPEGEEQWLHLDLSQFKQYYQPFTAIQDQQHVDCIIIFPKLRDAFLANSANWFSQKDFEEYVSENSEAYVAPFSIYTSKSARE
jgi:hypothetical protein